MDHAASNAGYATYLIPLVVIGLVALRAARPRRLRIETLWIAPLLVLALCVVALAQQGMPSAFVLSLEVAALVLGALLGWWRARAVHISVDPQTHQLTSRTSPIGMLIILGIFALRYGLRTAIAENAAVLHISAAAAIDVVLMLAVGLVCAQRLEIALRAKRLLDEARAG